MSSIQQNTNEKEQFWSRFAADFEKRNNYVIGKNDVDLLMTGLSKLPPMGNVLELGCGDGMYTEVLLKKSTSVLATDFSDEMVEVCRQRFSDIANLKAEKANCFELPYADKIFDAVFIANLIHIIPTPEKALREVKRVLADKGTIIVLSYSLRDMKPLQKLGMIYRYLRTYGKPPKDSNNMNLADAEKLMENEGFKVLEAKLHGKKSKAFLIRAEKF